ncbi:hypothetical protein [Flavobacterium sp. '19STA2R22 D10 B1']|uniref:hypothetical protein n=1 Tax=Flavobacterium aerium TaxID=3037261 RepID=UPI00278BC201|nr:hypothetical protein [Flavobacterium sp. '19STA2R22 D10 B1']
MITINNVFDLKNVSITENIIYLTGYYGINDGGGGVFIWDQSNNDYEDLGVTIISNLSSSGRWKRLINSSLVNVNWFGAIPNCSKYTQWDDNLGLNVIDSTIPIQNAINFCENSGFTLLFPTGKNLSGNYYYQYFVSDTLKINKTINIIGQTGTSILGDINNKPVFEISNCVRGRIENLIISGYKYRPVSGIKFISPDNQALELINITIYGCKYGVYCITPETINRLVVNKCDFSSNIRAGFYLNSSFDQANVGHNTPITFIHTIMNSNGYNSWMTDFNLDDPSDGEFYQLYINGAHNISYIAGQISNHGSDMGSINKSLIYISNGAGANFNGVDIEDIGSGSVAAFYANNFIDVVVQQSHIWKINCRTVFYFEGYCGYVSVNNVNLDNNKLSQLGSFEYAIDLANTNFYNNPPISIPNYLKPTHNYVTTFLDFTGPVHKLADNALKALDKSKMKTITNVFGGISPNSLQNSIWKNYIIDGARYKLTNNINTSMYIEKELINSSIVFCVLECTQDSFEGAGLFFILEYQNNSVITTKTFSTKGTLNLGGKFFAFASIKTSMNTDKIRFGFYNSNSAISNAYIPDHATVKGLTVYTDFHNPISKNFLQEVIF